MSPVLGSQGKVLPHKYQRPCREDGIIGPWVRKGLPKVTGKGQELFWWWGGGGQCLLDSVLGLVGHRLFPEWRAGNTFNGSYGKEGPFISLMASWNKMPKDQWLKESQSWAGNRWDPQRGREQGRKVVIFLMEQESIFHPVTLVWTKILIVFQKSKDSLVSWESPLPSLSAEQMALVLVCSIDMCLILVTTYKKIYCLDISLNFSRHVLSFGWAANQKILNQKCTSNPLDKLSAYHFCQASNSQVYLLMQIETILKSKSFYTKIFHYPSQPPPLSLCCLYYQQHKKI